MEAAAEREGKASADGPMRDRRAELAAAAVWDCAVLDFSFRTRRPVLTFAPSEAARSMLLAAELRALLYELMLAEVEPGIPVPLGPGREG